MKSLFRLLISTLLICALPVWAAPVGGSHRKSYQEMTPEEIRAEVRTLERELMATTSRLGGIPLTEEKDADKTSSTAPSDSSAFDQAQAPEYHPPETSERTGSIQRAKPARHLRRIHQQALEQARTIPEEESKKISMRTLIKKEVAKMEQEKRQSKPDAPKVVKHEPRSASANPDPVRVGRDGRREIELELPLSSGKGQQKKKEKIKVRVKHGVVELRDQIHGLNQMLVDDVVRMTGAPLQKKKQAVRKK